MMASRITDRLTRTDLARDHGRALVRIKELEEELRNTRLSTVCSLVQLLDLKDLSTGCHSTRLAEWAVRIGRELGMSGEQTHAVEVAALLHDVGKIGVPDVVMQKPRSLDDDERGLMNRHPEYGWAILRLFPIMEQAALFVLHHHERVDGTGYPGGLLGDQIPLGARIVSVIDAFDAMVSDRVYRKGLGVEEAKRRLILASGTQFDPAVIDPFIRLVRTEAPHVLATLTRPSTPRSS